MSRKDCFPTSIFFQVFAYATEDGDKVEKALFNIVPNILIEKVTVKKNTVRGHLGDPITVITAKLDGKRRTETFIKHLAEKLTGSAKRKLSERLHKIVDDKGNLFLRLSKQAAFLNRIQLGHKDVIKVKIHFTAFNNKFKKIWEYCKSVGLINNEEK